MTKKRARIVSDIKKKDWESIRQGFILVDSKTLGWGKNDFVNDILPILTGKQKNKYGFSIKPSFLNQMRFFVVKPSSKNHVINSTFSKSLVPNMNIFNIREKHKPYAGVVDSVKLKESLRIYDPPSNSEFGSNLVDSNSDEILESDLFTENSPFHFYANKGLSIIHDFKNFMDESMKIITINERKYAGTRISFSFPMVIVFKDNLDQCMLLADAHIDIGEHYSFNINNIRMFDSVPVMSTNVFILDRAYVDTEKESNNERGRYDVFIEFRRSLFRDEISLNRYKKIFKIIHDGLKKINDNISNNAVEEMLESHLFTDGIYSCSRLMYILFMIEEAFNIDYLSLLFREKTLIDSNVEHLDFIERILKEHFDSDVICNIYSKYMFDNKEKINKDRIAKYAEAASSSNDSFGKKPQIFDENSRYLVEKFRKDQFFSEQGDSPSVEKKVLDSIKNSDEILQEYMTDDAFKKLHEYEAGAKSDDVKFKIYSNSCRSLPFGRYTDVSYNITKIKEDLETKVYGLDSVKEHIIDYLAVMARNPDLTPPVLCLAGPPGIGKTTICKTIAESINRIYHIISCSSMAEAFSLSGNPFGYYSSKQGKIIDALIRAKVMNPLILLDEIDKSGTSHHNGNVHDALTTILDPEQNHAFEDNFLGFPVDISKIQFIATANDLDALSAPLRNRMSVIELPGYDDEEKFIIMKRSVLPEIFKDYCIGEDEVNITDNAIRQLIEKHGAEPGIREVKRVTRNLFARVVNHLESGDKSISIDNIDDFKYVGSESKRTIGFGN